MAIIDVSNLTFAYDSDNIFENVSFRLDTDWKLGFIGRNGRGKTTFLNLLLGKYEYQGTITSNTSFEYFPFQIADKAADTYDIISGVIPYFEHWELLKELSLLKVAEDVLYRAFNTLSEGERTKILIAALFLKENSFLLIDEPTNHLDAEGRAVLSNYLQAKKGFILVSHDRTFLDNCVDRILSINKANIEVRKGNFSSWLIDKENQDNFELSENAKLKKDIKRLEAASKEKAAWSDKIEASKIGTHQADRGRVGHQAAKMMKRSKAIEKRTVRSMEEKEILLKNIESAEELKISGIPYHSNLLCEFKDTAIFYGEKKVCENINFTIERGTSIALQGKNGSGKSSILKLITGEKIDFSGEVKIGSGLKISYVSQDTSGISGNLSDFAAMSDIDESLFKAILRKLGFSRTQFEDKKDISEFSGGQKKKVLIARSLCEKAHLYIWDEPLNYIDVISRIQIEELLLKYKPTIIFVEHDTAFCENVAQKKIELTNVNC